MTDHLTARYGLIHGAYWASYAAIAAYVNLYLLEIGFSSGAIGVLIALAGLLVCSFAAIGRKLRRPGDQPQFKDHQSGHSRPLDAFGAGSAGFPQK